MSKSAKKHSEAMSKIDRNKVYQLGTAVDVVKQTAYAKFDETVDVAVKLGVDPRHADQMVRGAVVLPNGLGKNVRVLVFAKGEKEKEALDAGADYVGADDLVAKIQAGWFSFDAEMLKGNLLALVEALVKAKPSAAKGTYIKKISLSSTMGAGINLDISDVTAQ